MKSDLLRRAIGSIDDDLIEEAENKKLPTGRKRLFAGIGLAAAALALAALGAFALGGSGSRGTVPPLDTVSVAEDPIKTPEGDGPARDTLGPSASRIDEAPDELPNADRETLLAYHIGDLYLGMPYEEAEKLLGKPKITSNTGPDLLPNGVTRDSMSWNLSGTTERGNDLTIAVADAGDGFVIDEIDVWADTGLSLPHGIRIGMTKEELLEAWPELETGFTRYEGNAADNGTDYCAYEQYAGDELRLLIDLEPQDGRFVVKYLTLGTFYKSPPFDEGDGEEPLYDFLYHGDPENRSFTLWRQIDGVWRETEIKEREAKRVEVLFGIEELGPYSGETRVPVWFVDFHNGTVAGVFDRNETGFVSKLEDPRAFARALEKGEEELSSFGLVKIEGCVFPAGVWDLLEEVGK